MRWLASCVFSFILLLQLGVSSMVWAQSAPSVQTPHKPNTVAPSKHPTVEKTGASKTQPASHSIGTEKAEHTIKSKVVEKKPEVLLEDDEDLNLGQITPTTKPAKEEPGLGQQEFFRVYSGLIFVLGVILISLWLLKRSTWFNRLKASLGGVTDAAVTSQENAKQFYQPQIMHRTRLGPGKELLTVYQAGQWLLLGSTAQTVNLVARLDEFNTDSLPKELAQDPGFHQIYEKYVEPIAKAQSTQNTVENNATMDMPESSVVTPQFSPQFRTESAESIPYSAPNAQSQSSKPQLTEDDDYEEIQMKDFDDWYDGPLISATMPKQR